MKPPKMKPLTILLLFYSTLFSYGDVRFDMPEDWHVEIKRGSREQFKKDDSIVAEKYASKTQPAQATIHISRPVKTEAELDDVIESMMLGMKKNGYVHSKTESAKFKNLDATHLSGEFQIDGMEGHLNSDLYIITTSDAVNALGIIVHSSIHTQELTEDIAKNFTVIGNPLVLSTSTNVDTNSTAYKVGYILPFAAIIIGVFLLLRRESDKAKKRSNTRPASVGIKDSNDTPPPLPTESSEDNKES